jgi:hypothetical protein
MMSELISILVPSVWLGMFGYLALLAVYYAKYRVQGLGDGESKRFMILETHSFIESMLKFFAQLLIVIVAFVVGGLLWVKLT